MTTFDEQGFEKRLTNLKDTQESVSQLSHWCLVNKQHHKKIVTLWLAVLKKVKIESRLTLFHLANDVIQYSKRKNLEFVDSWGTALQRATPMVRDEKVQKKILRIFKIWGERSIYEETFLTDLCGLLTMTTKKSSAQAQSHSKSHHREKPAPVAVPLVFEPQNLFLKIRDCVKLENDTDYKMKAVNDCPLALNDVDSLRASLKDRRHGDEAVADVEDAIERMKAYEEALRIEVQERRTLIELLRHGETFYENERGEAKVVFNAYRNFGSRVKSVKRKLDEVLPSLSSPIPSPDVNAPSPSPDSDIDLPNDDDLTGKKEIGQPIKSRVPGIVPTEMDNCFASFMGSGALPFDLERNIFGDSSANQSRISSPPNSSSQMDHTSSPGDGSEQGKPIEVISMRSKSEDENFGIGNFLKSLQEGSATSGGIGGGIPGLGDPLPVPPPVIPPTTTSYSYQLPPLQPTSLQQAPREPRPMQPPPLPPMMDSVLYSRQSQNDSSEAHEREDSWKTTLPPKFPTWRDAVDNEWERDSIGSDNQEANEWVPALPVGVAKQSSGHDAMETPESPPHFEKESFREPVEYDETAVGTGHGVADVDHRMLVTLSTPCRNAMERTASHSAKDIDHRVLNSRFKTDVDHRNLISLTGSPANDILAPPPSPPSLWGHDQDYRSIPMPPSNDERKRDEHEYRRGRASDGVVDNVESVDMEMSDEDDDFHSGHHRSGSQDKKWHDKASSERYDHHMDGPRRGSVIPTVGSGNLPLPPPPPPPSIPRPEFRTDLRVPPPPLDFLPMRPAVQDAFANQGIESIADVFPPVPPEFPHEFPPVLSLIHHKTPMRGHTTPVLGPVLLGVPPVSGPPPPRPLLMPNVPPHLRTNHMRLDMRNSPAHRRASSSSSRDSPPVTIAPPNPATPPATTSTTSTTSTPAHDPPATPKTPQKPTSETPSGPEESDTDSMEQYMNTVGLSDDEEFKAIVGAMDPEFICDVVEGPSRNGVDGSEVSNGDKASMTNSPKDGPPPIPPLLQTPTGPPGTPSTPDPGQTPSSGRGGFNQTPRGRPWKHRGGNIGRGGMTPQRFHGPRPVGTGSPGWGPPPQERSPFHHGRGRPGFRPLLSGVPRGMSYRAVMRGNPRFGW